MRILFSCDVVIDVFLALLARDLVERRLGDVDVPALDQLRHLPVKERQQQRADVRAVHVGIGHDDDFVSSAACSMLNAPSPLAVADAGADGGDHRADFGVLQHLVQPRFLDVDQLAANRQDRLETPVAPLLGRAAGGITLDDVELGSSGSRSEQSASLPGKPPPVRPLCARFRGPCARPRGRGRRSGLCR